MLRPAFALLLLAPLAACGGGDGNSTTISFNVNSSDGDALGGVDGNGTASIKVPGFEGSIKLPKIELNANNFEIDGVHLYPGSKIRDMNINAQDHAVGKDEGNVRVTFDSPATPAKVRDWFRDTMTKAGFTVQDQGAGLTGKTKDGDPFTLELTPSGADQASGVLAVRG